MKHQLLSSLSPRPLKVFKNADSFISHSPSLKDLDQSRESTSSKGSAQIVQTNLSGQQDPHNCVPSISTLPDELIIIIFLLSITSLGPDIRCKKAESPSEIRLSHVSRHWRSVALTTPMLWTTIRRRPNERNVEYMVAYLNRSQQSPFSLYFGTGYEEKYECPEVQSLALGVVGQEPDGTVEECQSALCKILKPHFSRCQNLHIESWTHIQPFVNCMFTSFPAPALRELYFSTQQEPRSASRPRNVFENNIAVLSRISLLKAAAENVLPSFSMVSHLRLDLPKLLASSPGKLSALEGAFGDMPLLEQFELYHADRWPSSARLTLPSSTRMLLFTVANWRFVGTFLQTLKIVPAQEMTICCDGSGRGEPMISFNAHFPRLTTLRIISAVDFPREVMLTIARGTSSIHHLSIGLVQVIRHSLAVLGESHAQAGDHSDPTLLWPQLRVLSINTVIAADILGNDLRLLLAKRAAHNCPIHTVHLSSANIARLRRPSGRSFKGLGVEFAELEECAKPDWW